ncbi:MAG: hypothetical protein ACXVIY_03110 [Mucilaginibacter sp.]
MPVKKKKYRINEILENLSTKENRKALGILPMQLGISPATFNNYRNIGIDDDQDIPHAIVCMLEQFFSLPAGGLQNFKTDIRPLCDVDTKQLELDLVKKFALTKPKLIPHYND